MKSEIVGYEGPPFDRSSLSMEGFRHLLLPGLLWLEANCYPGYELDLQAFGDELRCSCAKGRKKLFEFALTKTELRGPSPLSELLHQRIREMMKVAELMS